MVAEKNTGLKKKQRRNTPILVSEIIAIVRVSAIGGLEYWTGELEYWTGDHINCQPVLLGPARLGDRARARG